MYAYSWVTRGVNVLADVLPTGPIRISYNKFCYYAENRHFFAPQFDSINNIKTLHIYEYIYFQFVFYEAQLKQLHVWCVIITGKSWQLMQHELPGFASDADTPYTIVVQTAENFCTVLQHETMMAHDCQSLYFKLN